MKARANVLVVSRDEMLLQSRVLLLGAYFQVEGAGRVPEAELAMTKGSFDLVILCYSLSDGEYERMMSLCMRQKPVPRIIALNSNTSNHRRGDAEGLSMLENGPYELLRRASEVVGVPLKTAARTSQSS